MTKQPARQRAYLRYRKDVASFELSLDGRINIYQVAKRFGIKSNALRLNSVLEPMDEKTGLTIDFTSRGNSESHPIIVTVDEPLKGTHVPRRAYLRYERTVANFDLSEEGQFDMHEVCKLFGLDIGSINLDGKPPPADKGTGLFFVPVSANNSVRDPIIVTASRAQQPMSEGEADNRQWPQDALSWCQDDETTPLLAPTSITDLAKTLWQQQLQQEQQQQQNWQE